MVLVPPAEPRPGSESSPEGALSPGQSRTSGSLSLCGHLNFHFKLVGLRDSVRGSTDVRFALPRAASPLSPRLHFLTLKLLPFSAPPGGIYLIVVLRMAYPLLCFYPLVLPGGAIEKNVNFRIPEI